MPSFVECAKRIKSLAKSDELLVFRNPRTGRETAVCAEFFATAKWVHVTPEGDCQFEFTSTFDAQRGVLTGVANIPPEGDYRFEFTPSNWFLIPFDTPDGLGEAALQACAVVCPGFLAPPLTVKTNAESKW